MTKMRTLNNEERAFTIKNMARAKEERRRIEVKIQGLTHAIDEGLRVQFLDGLDKTKAIKRTLEEKLPELHFLIKETEKQLRHGVEVKDPQPEVPKEQEVTDEEEKEVVEKAVEEVSKDEPAEEVPCDCEEKKEND